MVAAFNYPHKCSHSFVWQRVFFFQNDFQVPLPKETCKPKLMAQTRVQTPVGIPETEEEVFSVLHSREAKNCNPGTFLGCIDKAQRGGRISFFPSNHFVIIDGGPVNQTVGDRLIKGKLNICTIHIPGSIYVYACFNALMAHVCTVCIHTCTKRTSSGYPSQKCCPPPLRHWLGAHPLGQTDWPTDQGCLPGVVLQECTTTPTVYRASQQSNAFVRFQGQG